MSPRISIRLLPRQSDSRLLELVALGNEHAFDTLVARYRPALVRYCRRLGLSDAGAEDVVQQSLMKAWLALSGRDRIREVRPWLYQVVHNNALNLMRRADAASAPLSDAHASAAAVDAIEGRLAAREALGHVAALPAMQRDAVVLTAIQGRSHDETAGVLGISDGAVRALLYRARTTLRSAAAALVPGWLLDRIPWTASSIGPGGDVSIATGVLGTGAVVAKLGALAAGTGLLVAVGATGVGGGDAAKHHGPARPAAVAAQRVTASATGTAAASESIADAQPSSAGSEDRGASRHGHRSRGEHHGARGHGSDDRTRLPARVAFTRGTDDGARSGSPSGDGASGAEPVRRDGRHGSDKGRHPDGQGGGGDDQLPSGAEGAAPVEPTAPVTGGEQAEPASAPSEAGDHSGKGGGPGPSGGSGSGSGEKAGETITAREQS